MLLAFVDLFLGAASIFTFLVILVNFGKFFVVGKNFCGTAFIDNLFGDAIVDGTKPSFMRRKFDFFEFQESLKWIYDNTYTREMMCGPNIHQDDGAEWYKAKYGLTDEQMDDNINTFKNFLM